MVPDATPNVGPLDADGGVGSGRFTPAVLPVLALRASSRALILACSANAFALLSMAVLESPAVPGGAGGTGCCLVDGTADVAVIAEASPHLRFLLSRLSCFAASFSLLDDICLQTDAGLQRA